MEMFSFIKDCLLTFNYPLAHSMSDEELGDIFKTSNRCFLISWMLKLLDSAYEEALENSDNEKEFLSNFVYELGFCTQKEKLPFMNGDLPVGQQVKILFNMFTFITDIKKNYVEENKDAVTNSEIINLINTNLNLFPMYGDIKLGSSEKSLKSAEFDKEINEIKAAVLMENDNNSVHLTEHKFNDNIEEFLEKLREELPNIKFVMENICNKKDTKAIEVIKLQSNSADILKNCRVNLKVISQFIKDINTIEEFMRNDFEMKGGRENNDAYYEMVNILYQEVSRSIKYIRCYI
ncbi:hypothetical protein NQ314_001700 [Rhamnusium bicolor]|uniref:Uncharacterized protein n=1 Tax=Rhamnusium bicolor TaxID=1586634 RepID=A0AAV8ZTL0_9CUCU|nr:hypothetical protein NQ314_001700 [Rhamnusium bicolor]